MATIVEYRDIPLDDLVIGKAQVRIQDPGKDIDELAASIDKQGLLQPIVVCEAKDPDKWEILTGQRRFLAHKMLKKSTISAAILDSRVDEAEAKTISITENLIRRKLSSKEMKDGILYLYNRYGSIKDVVETTGISRNKVSENLKYPRLIQPLKDMVDNQKIDINAALRAQDAAVGKDEEPDPDVAVRLAGEMAPMTDAQRRKFAQERKEHPDRPLDDVIEDAKTGSKVIQIVATVTQETHGAIKQFAKEESTNQDEATVALIEEALTGRGFL